MDYKKQIITLQNNKISYIWARPGFEPGTTRTLSEYHTPRPTNHIRKSDLKLLHRSPKV